MSPIRATPFHSRAAGRQLRQSVDAAQRLYPVRRLFRCPGRSRRGAHRRRHGRHLLALARPARRRPACASWCSGSSPATLRGSTPARALKALWLSDGRRHARRRGSSRARAANSYQLVSAAQDADWIAAAASRFGVTVRDVTEDEGGLAIVGPYAARLIAAPRPRSRTRSRDVPQRELAEHRRDAVALRRARRLRALVRGGRRAGRLGPRRARRRGLSPSCPPASTRWTCSTSRPACPGPAATMTARPIPTRPSRLPARLRLASLIDPDHCRLQRRPRPRSPARPRFGLTGLVLDGAVPAPFTPVLRDGRAIGRTLSSRYSPAAARARRAGADRGRPCRARHRRAGDAPRRAQPPAKSGSSCASPTCHSWRRPIQSGHEACRPRSPRPSSSPCSKSCAAMPS